MAVTQGTNPASTLTKVTADLSGIGTGGSTTQALLDDGNTGTDGDVTAGDNTYSFNFTVPANASGGPYSIPVTIEDAQHRKTTTTISLTVQAPVALAGSGAANPSPVVAGSSTLLTVAVIPATLPDSTGITVTANLAAIGGSSTQSLFDDGSNGDQTNGDNTFSFSYSVPSSTPGGTYSIPVTISDGQSRTASATISVKVTALALSINNVTANEGDAGTTAFNFTVTLSATPSSDVTVHFATADGTATAASGDYVAIPDTALTFLSGTATLTQIVTVNVNGDTAFEPDETFTVNLSNATNASIATATGTGTIKNDDPLPVSIMAIQGHGTSSPYAGTSGTVGTTLLVTPDPGQAGHLNIVTAVKSNGFYMQDSIGDGDPTTSDGVFVFNSTHVSVGDAVSVKGKVQEFHGSTEITSATVTVVSSGNAVPAAYDLSNPANYPSHDPTQGICQNAAIVLPAAGYQANNFACLDGMLVTMNHGLAVTPTSGSLSYSTTPVSDGVHANNVRSFYATADGTRPIRSGSIPGSAGIDYPGDPSHPNIPVYNNAPEAFEIYYPGLNFDPTNFIYNAGTQFHATGIMSGFSSSTTGGVASLYEMYPITMVTDSTPVYPILVATAEPGKLTIGTQNMLHFFNDTNDGADTSQYTDECLNGQPQPNGFASGDNDQCPTTAEYHARLQKMSKQIRLTLKAPVVQVVQELENYSTLVALANQIHSDDNSITYVPYTIKGNDFGGINIGILVRDSVTVNSVTQFYRDTRVNDGCNPSDAKPCILNDRPPVLLDATYQGYRFRVLAIYDRSLGSLAKTGYVGQKRMEEAVQVAGLVNALQHTGQSVVGNTQQVAGGASTDGTYTISGDDNIPVVVLGDFNAYEFSDGFVDVTGLIMGTASTDPSQTYYYPTDGTLDPSIPASSYVSAIGNYVRPNPVLFDTGTAPDPNGAYSYSFNAYAQEIDHIVITARAHQDFVRISHAHGNADASDSATLRHCSRRCGGSLERLPT